MSHNIGRKENSRKMCQVILTTSIKPILKIKEQIDYKEWKSQ
jgi:hypothetical protein